MKIVELNEGATAAELLSQGADEEVLVVRDGHAVALVVPFDDEDAEWHARESEPAFVESIARARRQVADGKSVGHDELKSQLGLG